MIKRITGLVMILLLLFPQISVAQESPAEIDLSKLPANAAVYIKLPDGKIVQRNGDRSQSAYSTIKLWVAAAVMKAVESGNANLTQSYTVKAEDKVAGTGNIVVGQTYTYDKLLELMLTRSDNSATNIMIKQAGGLYAVDSLAKSMGFQNTRITKFIGIDGPENMVSAKDGATFMEMLLQKRIVSASASDKIISILAKRSLEKADGIYIGRSILDKTQFLGKSGVGPSIRNDIGTFKNKAGGQVYMSILINDVSDTAQAEAAMAAVALQAYDGSAVGSAPTANVPVTIIGDSLTEGASAAIKAALPNATINAKVSRQWSEGLQILQELPAERKASGVIVFALGTNGPMTDESVDQVMKSASNAKVIFMTVTTQVASAKTNNDSHNAVIKKAPSRYPGKVSIADWSQIASAHADWFVSDGIHLTAEGTKAFADMLIKAIGSAAPSTTNTTIGAVDTSIGKWCTKVGNPTTPNPCAGDLNPGGGTPIPPGEFPFYCQGDPRWGNRCSMASAGCGPTSMAMVVSYFDREHPQTPPEIDSMFNRRGFRACGDVGSSMTSAIETYLKKEQGYDTPQLLYVAPGNQGPTRQLDLVKAQQFLQNGYLIIGSVNIHIYVIDAVDVNQNKVHLRDPARCKPEGSWYPNGTPWIGASGTGYYWYYAYAVKKTAGVTITNGGAQ